MMSRRNGSRPISDMWNWYYTDEHVERMMRRNVAYGIKPVRIVRSVLQVYGAPNFEGVHPQQCGYFRRKDRTQRRPELPRVPALLFYPRSRLADAGQIRAFRRLWAAAPPHAQARPEGPPPKAYRDLATIPVVDAETEALEMFELNESRAPRSKRPRSRRRSGVERSGRLKASPTCLAPLGRADAASNNQLRNSWHCRFRHFGKPGSARLSDVGAACHAALGGCRGGHMPMQ